MTDYVLDVVLQQIASELGMIADKFVDKIIKAEWADPV